MDSIGALIAGISGLLGVFGGALGTVYVQGRERNRTQLSLRTQYQLATLAKRIEVHQQAWKYVRQISRFASLLMYDEQTKHFYQLQNEFPTWLDSNSLYLDEGSWKAIEKFREAVYEYLDGYGGNELDRVKETASLAEKQLQLGVALPAELSISELARPQQTNKAPENNP